MAASYPGSAKSFTTKSANDVIEASHINDLQDEVTAVETALIAGTRIWPIGSVFISSVSTNPNTLLGFGTWVAFGTGRVLVGIDAGQTEFDVAGETGGAKTHTLSTAEMPSHNHTQDAHTHTQNSHNHTQDAHTHTQNSHTHVLDDLTHQHNTLERAVESGTGTTVLCATGGTPVLSTDAQLAGADMAAATATNQNATATNQAATAVNQNATATNQATGGGGAHNNLQPYLVVYMWNRTA